MSSIVDATLAELRAARETCGPRAVVGFSGGEDSRVVMDLATRVFDHVEGAFLELIPGLRCIEERLAFAERWGVTVRRYPSSAFVRMKRDGVYCWNGPETDNLPEWRTEDAWALARAETNSGCVLTGEKSADGMRRRRHLAHHTDPTIRHPIKTWRKYDVRAYLAARNIPRPPTHKGVSTDLDLSTPSVLWLADNYPDDLARVERVFPFVGAIVKRREWYGEAD